MVTTGNNEPADLYLSYLAFQKLSKKLCTIVFVNTLLKGHSTEDVIMQVVEEISTTSIYLVLFIYLSKAIDRGDHIILIANLKLSHQSR